MNLLTLALSSHTFSHRWRLSLCVVHTLRYFTYLTLKVSTVETVNGQSSMQMYVCVHIYIYVSTHYCVCVCKRPSGRLITSPRFSRLLPFTLFICAQIGPLLFITVYLLPLTVHKKKCFFVNGLIYMHLHYLKLVVFLV